MNDPFASFPTELSPWIISHGSPLIDWNGTGSVPITVGAAREGNCNNLACGSSQWSEGALYPFPFKKGMKLNISLEYQAFIQELSGAPVTETVDKIFISFVNGIPPSGTCNGIVDFTEPNYTSKQDILYEEDIQQTTWESFQECIVLNEDFSHIWITIKEDDGNLVFLYKGHF